MRSSLQTPIARPSALPATVIALGITSFLADVGSDMIFPLLPVFVASLGATPTFLGLVEGLADATAAGLKLVSGYLADRFRTNKPFVVAGYGLAALMRPLMALATLPWHVLAVRVTDRVGKGLRSAPRDVLIAGAVSADDAGRAFGFHRALDHAGAVVGPLLAAALLALGWSLREVFLVALIPGVLSVLVVLTVREPASQKHATALEPTRAPGETARFPPALRRYLAILTLFSLSNSSDAFLLLRARELGVSIAAIPLLWTLLHITKLVSSYVGGSLSDRVDRRKLILAGWLVYAFTYVALGFANQGWQLWALFVIYGSYYGLSEPAEKALIRDLAPESARGRAYGTFHFISGATAVPAGVLTGRLWHASGPAVALSVGAGIAVVASLLLVAVPGERSVGAT